MVDNFFWGREVFFETTVTGNTNGIQVFTQFWTRSPAVVALVAVNVRVNTYPIADLEVFNIRANRSNNPGVFVTQNNRWNSIGRAWQTIVQGLVSPTNSGPGSVNKDFVWLNFWLLVVVVDFLLLLTSHY